MGKIQMRHTLSEKDTAQLEEVIARLHTAETRAALKEVVSSLLLPLLKADSALYAWTDSNLLQPKLIDCVHIPEKDIPAIKKFVTQDPMAGYLLTHESPVIARDIALNNNNASPATDLFTKGKSRIKKGYSYFSLSRSEVITLALRDLNLGAGIHRKIATGKPWTVRDVRLMELIRPHFLMCVKSIVLSEELARHRSIVDILADSPTAIALVDGDMQITYSNRTWNESLVYESGQKLPQDLTVLLMKEKYKADPMLDIEQPADEPANFQFGDQDYQLSFTPVRPHEGGKNGAWLLQLKPWVEPNSKLEDVMRKAGLTRREREACGLIRQGIELDEIAKQLFISPHTVRTHLKRIHQKLGVHTRSQLMAALNPR